MSNDHDCDRVTDGLRNALDMMTDGRLAAVMVIGVYTDGRGYKMWQGGDGEMADQVKAKLLDALPLKADRAVAAARWRRAEEDDGA